MNLYICFYRSGRIEIESTFEAKNLKMAWLEAKKILCAGSFAIPEDKINKNTTKIVRKYKDTIK